MRHEYWRHTLTKDYLHVIYLDKYDLKFSSPGIIGMGKGIVFLMTDYRDASEEEIKTQKFKLLVVT